jgi:hypothetical protein
MKNLIVKIAYAIVFLAMPLFAQAQEQTATQLKKEVGLSGLSLYGGSFMYKKEIKPNVYRRMSFDPASIFYSKGNVLNNTDFGAGFTLGREKRKDVIEKVQFIYGPQFGVGFDFLKYHNVSSINTSFNTNTLTVDLNFAYLLGIIYHINNKVYIGFESSPSFQTSFNRNKNNDGIVQTKLNLISLKGSGYFQLTAMYRF